MPIKFILIVAFILILISLGSALFSLVNHKDEKDSKKIAKALSFRIGLSLLLFVALWVAYVTGLIKVEGVGPKMHMAKPGEIHKRIDGE